MIFTKFLFYFDYTKLIVIINLLGIFQKNNNLMKKMIKPALINL